jgi:hypothetical protein
MSHEIAMSASCRLALLHGVSGAKYGLVEGKDRPSFQRWHHVLSQKDLSACMQISPAMLNCDMDTT